MKFVHVKNSVHNQCDKDWVSVLQKHWPEVSKFHNDGRLWGAGYDLLCIYNELLQDERIHSCKALGNYVIPKLLSAISYAIPQPFKWEGN